MLDWQKYYGAAAEFAAPYVQRAGETLEAAAKRTGRTLRKRRRKAKRHIRLMQIKRILDIVTNLLLLAAALIAFFGFVSEQWKKRSEL